MLTCCKSDLLGADKLQAKSFKVDSGTGVSGTDDMTDIVIAEYGCQKMAALDPDLFVSNLLETNSDNFEA